LSITSGSGEKTSWVEMASRCVSRKTERRVTRKTIPLFQGSPRKWYGSAARRVVATSSPVSRSDQLPPHAKKGLNPLKY